MPFVARTLSAVLALVLTLGAAAAQNGPLKRLDTGNDIRGWDAVGRLDLGRRGFCTGALIAPHLVLTAAHCLFDKDTGARIAPGQIEFRAGWRNGRAAAYRGVKHAVAHPEYVYGGHEKLGRVAFDLAVIELDQPIRLPSILPFDTDARPARGDEVGVVSYAQDRSEAPALQEVCHVLARQTGVLVLSCDVDFGSSGAPIFAIRDGVARMVSVVSAKADYEGRQVALGTTLDAPLDALLTELHQVSATFQRPGAAASGAAGSAKETAKFLKP
ncbi:MAG: trypsin-like peptidase domain-containing protein [Paracoccaceae bacterium]|nr:MAG: trypsin-like peptidase domain-containing protein [Paracoccaceae bacterium]